MPQDKGHAAEWEEVAVTPKTRRLAVPGGWLYLVGSYEGGTMAFVPAPVEVVVAPVNVEGAFAARRGQRG